jgi:hypothetical protein
MSYGQFTSALMLVFILTAGLSMVFIMVRSASSPDAPRPDTTGCGIAITPNSSLTTTTTGFIMVGKIMMPTSQIHYRYDLICRNGTVIPGWR